MRISGGEWGGRALVAPKGDTTRPTTDGNRQALFNVLTHSFGHQPTRVLDLFAGSGALSFEALSRGAEKALLVEKDRAALDCIRKNRESLSLGESRVMWISSAKPEAWPAEIAKLGSAWAPFDTVFCDPPYGQRLAQRALASLFGAGAALLAPVALVCAETSIRDPLGPFSGWDCVQERERGDTVIRFFRAKLA
jgi:16S rRNA (guanine966-N2)-methyltransferase